MRKIHREMIQKYKIERLGFDFMGYSFESIPAELDLHHLLVPKCECSKLGYGKGFKKWNVAVLNRLTSHPYLHIIGVIDPDRFDAITSEMIDMKVKGFLDIQNILYIDSILNSFEKEHCGRWENGVPVVKEKYTRRLLHK